MQTKEQIHNANLLQQAMEQQKIASKAAEVYEALADLLAMKYDQFVEPIDSMHLIEAQCVLAEKFNEKKILKSLVEQVQ